MLDAVARDPGGLRAFEQDILDRWDRHVSIEAIAEVLGLSRAVVEKVVETFHVAPTQRERAELASLPARNDRFVAALVRAQINSARREEQRMKQGLLEVGEINGMLTDRIDSLCHELLPNGWKQGNEWVTSNLADERTGSSSLSVHIGSGHRRGWWRDFATHDKKGDALKLVAEVLFGGDLKRAVAWAKSWLHLDDGDPARIERHRIEMKAASEARRRAAVDERSRIQRSAVARWHEAKVLAMPDPRDRAGGDKVCAYLAARAIDLAAMRAVAGQEPGALRFHPALQYGPTVEGEPPLRLPAMVAMVTALDGSHIATHRTYLHPDLPRKAGAEELGLGRNGRANDAKKVLGSPLGGHIPLWKGRHRQPLKDIPPGTDIYVSEGIEDGLTAAAARPELRVVAMLALSLLSQMALPPQMGRLVILAQNDKPGSDAERTLREAVAVHREAGRDVRISRPPSGVKDLNELAMRDMRDRAAGDGA